MRGLIGLFLILVSVAFIWGGLQGTYVGLTNTRPLEVSCEQFARNQPGKTWLRLTDCRLDLGGAVGLKSRTGRTEGFYAPLIPENAASGRSVHLLVRAATSAELVKRAAAEAHEGMVLFGIEEDNRVRNAFDKNTDLNLASDYVILDSGKKPELGFSAVMLGIGLFLGAFMLRRLKNSGDRMNRERAQSASRTAEDLINAATAGAPGRRHAAD